MFRHQMCHPQGTIAALLQLYLCNLVRKQSKLPEDDTFGVETCRSLIIFIYLFIVIVLSLAELQIKGDGKFIQMIGL